MTEPQTSITGLFDDCSATECVGGPSAIPGYEIMAKLGRGGSAFVYLAWDSNRHKYVALKVLKPSVAADPVRRARFQVERQVLSRLDHCHIVRRHDTGEPPAESYLVLEHVAGGSLERFLKSGLPPVGQAVRLVEALTGAVAYIHRQGLIHGDLKPANVLLQPAGDILPADEEDETTYLARAVPKIADFELAQPLGEDLQEPVRKGVLGTPGYMAPEQVRSYGRGLGLSVDIYALGAILYRLVTGRPPFREASPRATLARVLSEDPLPPSRLNPQVPAAVEAICLKCLGQKPQHRYASAPALARELREFLAGVAGPRPASTTSEVLLAA
jgi:serine/threonine-protein kinase